MRPARPLRRRGSAAGFPPRTARCPSMLRRLYRSRSTRRLPTRARRRPALEGLEPRCVPTTAGVSGGVLNVVGTDGNDLIGIGPRYDMYGYPDYTKVVVDADDGTTRQTWTFDATLIYSFFI